MIPSHGRALALWLSLRTTSHQGLEYLLVGLFFFSFLFFYLCVLLEANQASHILLRGVPLSATSGDLRRAVLLAGLLGVTQGELARISNRDHFSN